MNTHRLRRLARLTQGAAIVGIGITGVGCSKDPPHVNAPSMEEHPDKGDAGAPSIVDVDAATDTETPVSPRTVNAPPEEVNPSLDAGSVPTPPRFINAPPRPPVPKPRP